MSSLFSLSLSLSLSLSWSWFHWWLWLVRLPASSEVLSSATAASLHVSNKYNVLPLVPLFFFYIAINHFSLKGYSSRWFSVALVLGTSQIKKKNQCCRDWDIMTFRAQTHKTNLMRVKGQAVTIVVTTAWQANTNSVLELTLPAPGSSQARNKTELRLGSGSVSSLSNLVGFGQENVVRATL